MTIGPHGCEWVCMADVTATLGECPVWSVVEQALYWVDVRGGALHRLDAASGQVRTHTFGEMLGGVALAADRTLVLAMTKSLYRFDPRTGVRRRLLRLEEDLPASRLNELRCDPLGRMWCGSVWDFGAQVRGSLYRVDAELRVQKLRTDIGMPRGLAFSLARNAVFFADSQRGSIDIASLAGSEPPQWWPWLGADAAPGHPHGAALDEDGGLWTVRAAAGCVVRIAPDGRVDHVVELPVSHPTACAFGGPALDWLFITSSRQKLGAEAAARQPWAGRLIVARLGWRGVAEPVFTPTVARTCDHHA